MEMLNEMRIGTLPEHERSVVTEDPYATDPARSERIVARSTTPFNGEAPLDALLHHITPEGEHYIRNHMPVPDAVQAAYELQACPRFAYLLCGGGQAAAPRVRCTAARDR